LAYYGPNKQLREFHRLFTTQRDHKVGEAIFAGGGKITGYAYKCPVCDEFVDRSGKGFRHEARMRPCLTPGCTYGLGYHNTHSTGEPVVEVTK
jgi:hypothetical protein